MAAASLASGSTVVPALAGAAGIEERSTRALRNACSRSLAPRRVRSLVAEAAASDSRREASRDDSSSAGDTSGRRAFCLALSTASAAALLSSPIPAQAVSTSRRANQGSRIPEDEFTTLPTGLKIYDIQVGTGPLAKLGDRVTVHYVVQWKGITFMTSRQGMGVTGGTPYGFDLGSSSLGMVLKGLDQGVEGMRAGGVRQMIVPPELAYGNRGIQEIPPNATLQMNVELLAVKQNAYGTPVKLIEVTPRVRQAAEAALGGVQAPALLTSAVAGTENVGAGTSTPTSLTPSVPLTKLLGGRGLTTVLLLLALTATRATPLRRAATSSTAASAASASSAASATSAPSANATASSASTAAADTSNPATTPTTTPTPSTATTTTPTAPACPTSALAPLALAGAAPPARGRRSPDRLETTEVGRSS
ncbi:unnamed protein product [Closterium sp. NIES-53]